MSSNNNGSQQAEVFHLHTCKQENRLKNIELHVENIVISIEKLCKKVDVYMDDTQDKFAKIETHLQQMNEFLIHVVHELKDR
jgi:uncharacterized protein YoxC